MKGASHFREGRSYLIDNRSKMCIPTAEAKDTLQFYRSWVTVVGRMALIPDLATFGRSASLPAIVENK